MRTFVTGVCVATTFADGDGERRHEAVTVRSLVSVSLQPPLISMVLPREPGFFTSLLASRVWTVSILDVAGDDLARSFGADPETRARALRTCVTWAGPRTGALVLAASAWLECRLYEWRGFADSAVVIGEVLATGGRRRRPPLVSLNGALRTLACSRADSRPPLAQPLPRATSDHPAGAVAQIGEEP
jgi:flavin reductase (DIM6/NTAB) family NADH-FMN oxidoreductase RutF